jgi:hypothetical protein
MYRRPRFLEVLHAIREEMSREADYDVDLFAELVRSGARPGGRARSNVRKFRDQAPPADQTAKGPTPRKRAQG